MSVEQAKAFIEKMKTDEAFREKIMAIETLTIALKLSRMQGLNARSKRLTKWTALPGKVAWLLPTAGGRENH